MWASNINKILSTHAKHLKTKSFPFYHGIHLSYFWDFFHCGYFWVYVGIFFKFKYRLNTHESIILIFKNSLCFHILLSKLIKLISFTLEVLYQFWVGHGRIVFCATSKGWRPICSMHPRFVKDDAISELRLFVTLNIVNLSMFVVFVCNIHFNIFQVWVMIQ